MASNLQWKERDGNEMKIDHYINGQQSEITEETEILNSSSIKIRTDIFSLQQTELSNDSKNVGKNNAGSAIESTIKMNDDQNSNSSSSTNNNNKSENTLETSKLLVKNGSANGTAAAALITTSGTFHLPAPIQQTSSGYADSTATRGSIYHPPIAQINSVPASVRGSGNNNGLSPSPTPANTKKSKAMAAATSAATGVRLGASVSNQLNTNAMSSNNLKSELGVLDYSSASSTTIIPSGAIHNASKQSSGNTDVSRSSNLANVENQPVNSAYGGRLQFFKDGKFILELARAKDGERGGWISVPRKLFRSPSATSYTVTPTSALSSVYQNKECSTSLSFSDDNSSVQSSPWQRDHCWKQSTPRRDISKEMSLHYVRPKGVTLTTKALLIANRKKRKPHEVTEMERNIFIALFEENLNSFKIGMDCETDLKFSVESKKKLKNDILEEKRKNLRNGSKISCEEDGSSCSSSVTLTGEDCTNGLTNTELPELSGTEIAKNQCMSDELPDLKIERDIKIEKQEEMHTSEDEANIPTTVEGLNKSTKLEVNGESKNTSSYETQDSKVKIESIESIEGEEKRLKKSKIKIRAKLTTIIQKLIDKVPIRLASLAKNHVSTCGASSSYSSSSSNVLAQKVSPPSSSAASRLVEYHQQHVSPRKRILREFEKVSLEDNSTVAGGKRSRAKGTSTSTTGIMTSQFRCDKSPTNRIQANLRDCNTLANSTISSSSTVVSNGNHLTSTSSNKHLKPITTTSSAQPRLYSSYSIHSLLSGNSTSNSSNSSNNQKKHSEQAVISNINYQHHQQIQNKTDPSHLRTMLASPKSPESNINSCGGKSPSSSTHRKRSPPYVSAMQDSHSRSPISNLNNDYGQKSPHSSTPESGSGPNISHKPRYLVEHSIGSTLHSTSVHISQQQGLYSNYMMSPKYVTAPQSSLSPNSNSNSNSTSINVVRSPRHSSAFNSNSQSNSKTMSTTFSAHIPNSSSSSGLVKRELSPPRSLTASPRDSTPRTVPKKTASIRRQFASPNASTTSSCPSPSDRNCEEVVVQDRKTPITSNQNLLQGSSPGSTIGSINSPFNYYMYPSPASSVPSSHSQSSGPPPPINNTAAAVAAAAAYIPSVVSSPYYHPYILTLAALRHNPLWMHHYPGTSPGAGAPVLPPPTAASISPPFHSFPYNGAASIAAAFNGMATPMSPAVGTHYQQNAAIAAVNHHNMLMTPATGIHSGLNMSALTAHTTKLTDNTTEMNTVIKSTPSAQNMEATPTALYPNSIKDELSSDVPLNLSKH
ncbi:protein hairless [Teleopsis dalmanni]|uniref:protein hairless n=1 Tax=Teleopsis dalmanni TaxID=139649 RepID=UPI0018CD8EAF|nr:protein hairless [Teleopsis dalmanni]XP_037945851.1 protein hairless [Teleopsis dalmanni]